MNDIEEKEKILSSLTDSIETNLLEIPRSLSMLLESSELCKKTPL